MTTKGPAGKNKPGSSGGGGVVNPIPSDDDHQFEPPQPGSARHSGDKVSAAHKKKPGSSGGTGVVAPIPGEDPFEPPKG